VKALFWLFALLIAFAYAGYPAWLYFRARFWPRPVRRANIFPMITILLAARNEEENLVRKLQELDGLDFPENQLNLRVVSADLFASDLRSNFRSCVCAASLRLRLGDLGHTSLSVGRCITSG
jgi:cellulose synthase/poly-beta-1,6-N-acetylglucosamine synthase-like glycosyltransferase